ncbi:MAG: glycerate kinase [Tetrasphaera sp.]|nr:glycerate kinase [Tetrasphaera sp.]
MRVLVACDKFKGSLTATEVADHIRRGLLRAHPGLEVRTTLVADGGDGMLAAAEQAGFTRVPVTVTGPTGPTGPRVDTAYAVRRRPDAVGTGRCEVVVELADACGLLRLPDGIRAPLTASSRGLGEVIAEALRKERPTALYAGIGGSASTDGGSGMLAALGIIARDAAGEPVPDGGAGLAEVAEVDARRFLPRLALTHLEFACDVDSPLTGPSGAAHVFAPQKGATPEQVAQLDAALTHWADVVTARAGHDVRATPGAGAAGGVGYAALALLGARLRPGVEIVLDLVGFDAALTGCDLVITGEGSLDAQTLLGKTPAGVARRAQAHGIPVVAVCGRATLTQEEIAGSGIAGVYALTDLEPDPQTCMAQAGPLLERLVAERVSRALAPGSPG